MNIEKENTWILKWSSVLIFFCVLQGMLFWPFAYFSMQSPLNALTIVSLYLLSRRYGIKRQKRKNQYLIFAFVLIVLDSLFLDGLIITIPFTICYLLGVILFRLNDRIKQEILIRISLWFSYLIGISLFFYIIFLFIELQPLFVLDAPFGYGERLNYVLFIQPPSEFIHRFSGPFIEPGHLGCFSVFILFANKFDFKNRKYLFPILLGLLFSLSLAAYVLLFIAVCMRIRWRFKYVINFVLIFIAFHVFVTSIWNDGNNPVKYLIYDRLEYDEDKGVVGNNRSQLDTDRYFDKMCSSGIILIGKGNSYFREMYEKGHIGGAGIKLFLIQYGYIGLLLVFLYYSIMAVSCINRKFALQYLLLLAACFIQRSYPFHAYWLVPFILSLNNCNFSDYVSKKYYSNGDKV